VVICLSVAAADNVAHAFTDPLYFTRLAKEGGTEGRWFTGGPADGYGCGACHTPDKAENLVVEGLPMNGYQTERDYYVRIAWPETAARTFALYDAPPPARLPRTALVTEMIAESGEDSGMIHGGWPDPGSNFSQGSLKMSNEDELCHPDRVRPRKRYGYALYRQPANHVDRTKPVATCSGTNLTRCLLVVNGCGSKELRFTWRSPKQAQGVVWFSASFVTTDHVSSSPDGDAVSEVTIPIAPAGGGGYEAELEQSCSLVAGPSGSKSSHPHSLLPWFAAIGLLWLRRHRSPRRGGRS
jgi:hypothetical protein